MFPLLGAALQAWTGRALLHREPVADGVRPVAVVPPLRLVGAAPAAL
ncbi:hypothetical protein [Streptomyces sp. WM6368]|nr:hypothetical protein [Streptomyces sp. WM6368]